MSLADIFKEMEDKVNALISEISLELETQKAKTEELRRKIEKVEAQKAELSKNEDILRERLDSANRLLEQAKAKDEEATVRLAKAEAKEAELKQTDEALLKQREEIAQSRRDLEEHRQWLEVEERVVKFDRLKVEKLIKDNEIRTMMKEKYGVS